MADIDSESHINREYDYERKDKKRRAGRVVLFILLALLVAGSFILYLESTGSAGGEFLDRITVRSYLNRNYKSELSGLKITSSGFNAARGRFEYDCVCDKGTFRMAAKGFRVRYDGFYDNFMCDPVSDEAVGEFLRSYMTEKWDAAANGKSLEMSSHIRVPLNETAGGGEPDPAALLEKYGDTLELEVKLSGEKLTFDEYKQLSYSMLDVLRGTLRKAPEFMQVFYYREPDGGSGERDKVLSYESRLSGISFNYNEGGYMRSTDTNFVVELGEKEQKALRRYTIIRIVNFVVIGATVVGLLTLWIVRRIRKKRRRPAA